MTAKFHRRFVKDYQKLSRNQQKKCDERLLIFESQPFRKILDNHALKGRYIGYRSIDIAGDLRAIYSIIDKDTAYFIAIDTHSNLYS